MSYPSTIKELVEENAKLREENGRLREALSLYARRYDKDGKCCNWRQWVWDSYSGESSHFDWHGDEQDEPWEIAEKALWPEEPKP